MRLGCRQLPPSTVPDSDSERCRRRFGHDGPHRNGRIEWHVCPEDAAANCYVRPREDRR